MTAQHDYIIANAVGSDVRADINLVLAAIAHQNEGATEPATMYAYQFWADTSTDKLKQRNAANTAWIDILTLSTGDPLGSVTDASNLLNTAARKLPKVTVTQSSNALTISMVSQYIDFRNATLATGTPVTVSTGTPTDLVIPATSNLGMTATTVSNRYAVLLAYNAGTPVLCVSNLAGGLQLDETNLISPTTIGAASSSATTIYSAEACAASTPYKVIAIFDAVFTTGTGWSTPTLVHPCTAALLTSFGAGQTWQTVARTSGTPYYNTTGRDILLMITAAAATTGTMVVGSYTFPVTGGGGITLNYGPYKIGPGESYTYTQVGGTFVASERR